MNISELVTQVDEVCEDIERKMEGIEDEIEIGNKVITKALEEQVKLQLKWERITATVGGLYEECKRHSQGAYSEAFENRMVNDNRSWSVTEAKILADNDQRYNAYKIIENKIAMAYKECVGIVKTLDARKYALKNLTDLVIKDSDNYII